MQSWTHACVQENTTMQSPWHYRFSLDLSAWVFTESGPFSNDWVVDVLRNALVEKG